MRSLCDSSPKRQNFSILMKALRLTRTQENERHSLPAEVDVGLGLRDDPHKRKKIATAGSRVTSKVRSMGTEGEGKQAGDESVE